MAERTGYWVGPGALAGPAGGDADPTGGRHAFDHDAALTPIFTTLRRTARSRPLPAPPPHEWVDRFHDDPPTMLIPIVRPLYAVEPDHGYDPYDPYDQHVPVPSPTETTMFRRSSVGLPAVHERVSPDPVRPRPAYDDRPLPAATPLDPGYELPYHDAPRHELRQHDRVPLHAVPDEPVPHDPAAYDEVPSGVLPHVRGRFDDRFPEPNRYHHPVVDTGRHHRRLAPAGW